MWYTYLWKCFSGIHRVGCTYLRKCFSRITVWDVHTYGNDWVLMPHPIAHGPACVPGGPIPDDFRVVWKGPPYRTHSLGDGSKCCRGKGLKTVCIAPTRTSEVSFGPEKISKNFAAFGLRLVLIFCEVKNKQKTATGTWHHVNSA